MICAKFDWNWPSGSGEKLKSSMYFHYFVIISPSSKEESDLVIISPWKKEDPSFKKLPFIQG